MLFLQENSLKPLAASGQINFQAGPVRFWGGTQKENRCRIRAMPTEAIELTPDRVRLMREATDKILAAFAEAQLTDAERMLALTMILNWYEEKTGRHVSGMVGVPRGARDV